ncbi:methylenetetrahydrofolate reductase [NAD(P)H] [Sandarakinorhabdus sp.]|uniref:methylenetetrahydrofolate reductase [NAD(P)H] n=1 Tax=Sandarakinorhabdus sp. TaxID=1916663 RepID=UPI00334243EF
MAEAARALNGPLYADLPGDLAVSFEFFPPKTPAMQDSLWQAVETLVPLGPRFFSVTYGAGGSTRERTHATVARIASQTPVAAAAHLTCVNATAEELDDIADDYWAAGVRHIVALRGDPPSGPLGGGEAVFTPVAGGHASAAALVAALKRRHDFEISVSCYPEVHPEAASPAADLAALKAKCDAGATRAISQFFFEPDSFFRFRDKVAAAGIDVELVPGILPVTNFANLKRMAAGCNTNVPVWMAHLFEALDDKPAARQLVAATVAAELSRRLYAGGVRHFHFYTLNRAELSYAICHMLGKRPVQELAA